LSTAIASGQADSAFARRHPGDVALARLRASRRILRLALALAFARDSAPVARYARMRKEWYISPPFGGHATNPPILKK